MDKLNPTSISNTENEAELIVMSDLNNKLKNVNEIKLEDVEMYTDECGPIIEESAMCLKNSALLQDSMDNNLNTSTVSNTENGEELTLTLDLNNKHKDIHEVKFEIKLANEEIYRDEYGPGIEETEDVYVNLEDAFVKEEGAWKREEGDDKEKHPMVNNSTECIDNESGSEISENSNAHITNTDFFSSEFTCKQVLVTNKKELNAATKRSYTCSTCSKSFITKFDLKSHAGVHTGEKPYNLRSLLDTHMQTHTGEKPHECLDCGKCFKLKSNLSQHIRVHTGEKPFKCSICEKCFSQKSHLVRHMRVHTGEKSYVCSECGKCFNNQWNLDIHTRVHTGEKPYICSECGKCFNQQSHLTTHMRVHADDKQYECFRCEKCFRFKSNLVSHMRTHTKT